MNEIHEEIFAFLFEKYLDARAKGEEFYFKMLQESPVGYFFSFWDTQEEPSLQINISLHLNKHDSSLSLILYQKLTVSKNLTDDETYSLAVNRRNEANKIYYELAKTLNCISLDKHLFILEPFDKDAIQIASIKEYKNFSSIQENIEDFLKIDKRKIDTYLNENRYNCFITTRAFIYNYLKRKTKQSNEIKKYDKKSERPPFYVLSDIYFRNFQGITKLEITNLPWNAQWIFLTGKNAYGKTTVLQALARALSTTYQDEKTLLEVGYFKNDNYAGFELAESSHYIFNTNLDPNTNKAFPPIAAYGVERLKIEDYPSATGNLLNGKGLYSIEDELFLLGSNKQEKAQTQFEILKEAIISFVPAVEIALGETAMIFTEKDTNGLFFSPVSFSKLAAGYRSMISLVGNIILQLSPSKDDIQKTKGLEGFVIIDEIELHLHPENQKMIVEKLTSIFPEVQFIVSTHSPIPLLGAPKDSIILHVNRTKEEGIVVERLDDKMDFYRLLPEALLSSPIFDFDTFLRYKDSRTKEEFDIFDTDSNYNEIIFNKMLDEKLTILANSDKNSRLKGLFTQKKHDKDKT